MFKKGLLTLALFGAGLAAATTSADAAIVNLSASGTLTSADGFASVGDTFSFNVSYDDAAVGGTDGSLYFFDPIEPLTFVVDGVNYVTETLFSIVYDPSDSTLRFGPPGDYTDARGFVTVNLGRPDGAPPVLPTASEINGKTGTFRFEVFGLDFGSGSGPFRFVSATTTVPETGTWLMLVLGFGLVGGALRSDRRRAVTA